MTPLSVAFIWHMHQPDYKDHLTGEYLMPWVRLHAIKDYLDMVTILKDYPKIRQTFNLVPSLIDQLEDYCRPDTQDKYLALTLAQTFTEDDKHFLLQRFFDAVPHTMIARSIYYSSLMEKREQARSESGFDTSVLNDVEYQDLTALFNLVWFDPSHFETYPELNALWEKARHYTLADRTRIIKIQREIIRQVIGTYKEYQDAGQIEITTTPYYHPILPLLIDSESARQAMPNAILPDMPFRHPADAERQIQQAIEQYETLFGQKPLGLWPSEQSISQATVELLATKQIAWTVSNEGNLAQSLGIQFEKDAFGNVLNAEVLCQPYTYAGVTLLFRHLTLSDLIGFSYADMPPEQAVADFMARLKQIQQRCTQAGLQHPIVTIALDGENCWESYPQDGQPFLKLLYEELSADAGLNVCRVRDYLENVPQHEIQTLPKLHAGSWINSNFHVWIGDPLKNVAWNYLSRTRDDLVTFEQTNNYNYTVLEQAWNEIDIAEGSDWFWWYGEPNHSGQDELFDMQFRRHLANVYTVLNVPVPAHLHIPITLDMRRHGGRSPHSSISPRITGSYAQDDAWLNAGCFDVSHGAMHRTGRLLNKVQFGSDNQAFYLRFDVNAEAITPHHEMVIYLCTPGKTRNNSPVRAKNISARTAQTQRFLYAYELQLTQIFPGQLNIATAESLPDYLWLARPDFPIQYAYMDYIALKIPFESMGIAPGDYLQFAIAIIHGNLLDEFQPQDELLSIQYISASSLTSVPA